MGYIIAFLTKVRTKSQFISVEVVDVDSTDPLDRPIYSLVAIPRVGDLIAVKDRNVEVVEVLFQARETAPRRRTFVTLRVKKHSELRWRVRPRSREERS